MKPHAITSPDAAQASPRVRNIDVSDLKYALRKGREDFLTLPSSLFFLALIYPIVGIGLVAGSPLPLIFPLMSGFALVGPFASAEKAAKLCNGLKAAGGDCIIQKN